MEFRTPKGKVVVFIFKDNPDWGIKPNPNLCCARIRRGSGDGGSQCGRTGSIGRIQDGKTYMFCKTHDPWKVAARKQVQQEKWDREAAIRQAGWALDDLKTEIGDAVIEGSLDNETFLNALRRLQKKAIAAKEKLHKLKT